MNTRAYLKFFKKLRDCGELPQDLYESLTAEIDKDGRMNERIYKFYLDELERRRLFLVDGTPFDTRKSAKTDGTYKYKHEKNPFWHIAHAVAATLFKFAGWLGSGLVYGMWHMPKKYREKLKGVRACVSVCNHVGYIDSCLTRFAFGARKQYIIAAPHNCKSTLGGLILRTATVLPLPKILHGAKPFNEMLEYVTARGAAVHFYAEKSMWVRYKKPRPYQDGPFYYACRLNVPVVPLFICFKQPKGLRKLLGLPRADIHISDPLYPDASLSPRNRQAELYERVRAATQAMYEEHYGVPLEYLPQNG